MKIKVNRKHFIEVDNILKIVEKSSVAWIYRKEGYPMILKADCSKSIFLLRCVNARIKSDKIKELRDAL